MLPYSIRQTKGNIMDEVDLKLFTIPSWKWMGWVLIALVAYGSQSVCKILNGIKSEATEIKNELIELNKKDL